MNRLNRRELLSKFAKLGSGVLSAAMIGGCGGSGGNGSKAIVTVSLNREESRVVSVAIGRSVIEAIKSAFAYERTGDINDLSGLTTIGGISGHWLYEVDGERPGIHAQDYPIQADCWVELRLFG